MIIAENGINWVMFYDLEKMETWREHKGEITTDAKYVSKVWADIQRTNDFKLKINEITGIAF